MKIRWIVGWIKKIEKKMDGWMDQKTIMKRKMDGWMDKKIDGLLDGLKKYMKKYMDGWKDTKMKKK